MHQTQRRDVQTVPGRVSDVVDEAVEGFALTRAVESLGDVLRVAVSRGGGGAR
ncbi:hypothetical protein GCM10010303_76690 [Streptomyces purpurascens]|nr:hypothetical protein GCM10010303_76690 [Streptomyces purpurascens]